MTYLVMLKTKLQVTIMVQISAFRRTDRQSSTTKTVLPSHDIIQQRAYTHHHALFGEIQSTEVTKTGTRFLTNGFSFTEKKFFSTTWMSRQHKKLD